MNPLEKFVARLRELGLSQRQIDETVSALNEYNTAKFAEQNAQTGRNGGK